MKIGFTYDCKEDYMALDCKISEQNELYSMVNIDVVADTLRSLGHDVTKIGNAKALINRVTKGENWDIVFNLAEGLNGRCRESSVPSILEIYDIPYVFSDPLVMTATLDKAIAKRIVRGSGVPTSDFVLVEDESFLDKVNQELIFPVFAKPNFEGSSIGVTTKSIAYSKEESRNLFASLSKSYSQPILFENYLSGREFTVCILGTGKDAKVLGVLEIKLRHAELDLFYSREVKDNHETMVDFSIVIDQEAQLAAEYALKIWQLLGCRDAGRIDFRLNDKNIPCFLEVNPIPGLLVDSDLPILSRFVGIEYRELIDKILNSAISRYPSLKFLQN